MNKVCPNCNSKFTAPPSGRKYCKFSCYDRTGSNNPKWKGGILVSDGYRYVYKPHHPDAIKLGYVLEHRLVMEKLIGRRLNKSEAVHHLNHNRLDNRPENLELCSSNGKHFIEHHLVKRNGKGQFYQVIHSATYSVT